VLDGRLLQLFALSSFHLSVAATVGKGIIDQGIVDHYVVLGALVGAISWNIITWYYGNFPLLVLCMPSWRPGRRRPSPRPAFGPDSAGI